MTKKTDYEHLSNKVDKILLILEGDGTFKGKGLVDYARETNGKVKIHQKLIFGAYAFAIIILGWFISHLTIK